MIGRRAQDATRLCFRRSDGMDVEWKEAREAHVAGLQGSSMSVLCWVSVILPLAGCLSLGLGRMGARYKWSPLALFIASYGGLTLPLVGVFLRHPGWEQGGVMGGVFVVGMVLNGVYQGKHTETNKREKEEGGGRRVAHLSTYRAILMVSTAVAILGVDFHAFPRAYAKTETYGVSLMDVGVGSFVFSKGLVSTPGRAWEGASALSKVGWELIPLLVMANIRFVVHKAIGYQEHVTEYGVHLSFYHTLCGVLIIGWILPRMSRAAVCGLGIGVGVLYEAALLGDGGALEAYLLNPSDASRTTSFVGANREGIFSLCGFGALLLVGMGLGGVDALRSTRRVAISALCAWGVYFGLTAGLGLASSRRLANGPYIAWIVAHNMSLVGALSVVHSAFAPSSYVSPAVSFINSHQLLFFILANLCTGIVNLSIDTLSVGDGVARLVMSVYVFAVPAVVCAASGARARARAHERSE